MARERKFLISTKTRYAGDRYYFRCTLNPLHTCHISDGQSIATRLAKNISSTTSTLKRAISQFNGMCQDILEGSTYTLPRHLSWENVTNFEELTSLEVTSHATSTTIPIDLWVKVVRASEMKRRAIEEQIVVRNEMQIFEDSVKEEHSLIQRNIVQSNAHLSQFQQGCLNLLYHRLLFCES